MALTPLTSSGQFTSRSGPWFQTQVACLPAATCICFEGLSRSSVYMSRALGGSVFKGLMTNLLFYTLHLFHSFPPKVSSVCCSPAQNPAKYSVPSMSLCLYLSVTSLLNLWACTSVLILFCVERNLDIHVCTIH